MKLQLESRFRSNKICIVGGGNIGTLLAAELGAKKQYSVRMLTSKPELWNKRIEVNDSEDNVKYTGEINIISDKPEEVISDADIIIFTVPSHIFPETIKKIEPFIRSGAKIGVMPGSGGSEFYTKGCIEKGCTLFGFQRVYGIARIKEYGKSVYDLGKKKELYIGAIPINKIDEICDEMENIFGVNCKSMPNYLNVTLTPSNPILHTSRLYSILHEYKEGDSWEKVIYFYKEWDDKASKILIECDKELQTMCKEIENMDLKNVKSLRKHYEVDTVGEMTKKISSIKAFENIKFPMKKNVNRYTPDFQSRYFEEDFSYGLCIIKGFCEILKLDTPNIDQILMWFEKIKNVEYYIGGKFIGKDLNVLPIPQNYGINCKDDIIAYYTERTKINKL